MDISIKNARVLAIIGMLQFLPFTIATIYGFWLIYPIILWATGFPLFLFYVRHSFTNKKYTFRRLQFFWVYSLLFNGVVCLLPEFFDFVKDILMAILYELGILELLSIPENDWEYVDIFSIEIVWITSIVLHIALSGESLIYLLFDQRLNAKNGVLFSHE